MINVLLIGAPKTGKSAFVKRHFSGNFEKQYFPTNGLTCYYFTFGDYEMKVFDGKYMAECGSITAAIAFYTPETIDETDKIVENFINQYPDILIINVWSFFDVGSVAFDSRKLVRGGRKSYCISSKSNYNFDKPFLDIMRFASQNETWNFPTI